MNIYVPRCLCRVLSKRTVALAAALVAFASFHTGEVVHAEEFEDELCGWVTHDSCPYPRTTTRTSSAFEQTIATAAATACASAGISVEQIVEPFAMVGPQVVDSMNRVKEFQVWWREAVSETRAEDYAEFASDEPTATDEAYDPFYEYDNDIAEGQQLVRLDDIERETTCNFDQRLRRLASEEPIDVNVVEADEIDVNDLGESVLIQGDTFGVCLPDPVSITGAAAAQVGASAIVVSIEDSYLPYDLSARDLRVWSVFPLVTEPFCVRSRGGSEGKMSLWDEFDEAIQVQEAATSSDQDVEVAESAPQPTLAVHGSADCLLDEMVWSATLAIEDESTQKWLRPSIYGERLAALALSTTRVAESAAERLAANWPAAEPLPLAPLPVAPLPANQVPTAGDRLLARAGAVESSRLADNVVIPPQFGPGPAERIAEAPANLLR